MLEHCWNRGNKFRRNGHSIHYTYISFVKWWFSFIFRHIRSAFIRYYFCKLCNNIKSSPTHTQCNMDGFEIFTQIFHYNLKLYKMDENRCVSKFVQFSVVYSIHVCNTYEWWERLSVVILQKLNDNTHTHKKASNAKSSILRILYPTVNMYVNVCIAMKNVKYRVASIALLLNAFFRPEICMMPVKQGDHYLEFSITILLRVKNRI